MPESFRNWSGSVHARPREVQRPRTETALAEIVARSAKLRVAGSGHSFMPLCETDGTLVDLSELAAELTIASDGRTAWAPAGWSLRKLTAALFERGYALPNQGDIDAQALAGAISTGTHGTGAELGSLSSFARGFRLMLADGAIVECSARHRPDVFNAARLSLGLIGIMLRIQIEVLPAYRLEERIRAVSWGEISERFAEIAATHRHAEFWAFPYAERVILKTLHPTDDPSPYEPPPALDEQVFRLSCALTARAPLLTPKIQQLMMLLVMKSRRVGPAHQIFPTERTVRFEEMEYELPRAAGLPALREAIEWLRRRRLPVAFPFEFRWTAGDDIWLSPFNRGAGASVSVHQYSQLAWRSLFADAEPILRAHAGRPHWAKRHSLRVRDVFELYPAATSFCRVRAELDPGAKFANQHLSELFDIEGRGSRV